LIIDIENIVRLEVSDLPVNEAECIARLRDEKKTPAERKLITEVWDKLKTR
jgi:hypothetical protein